MRRACDDVRPRLSPFLDGDLPAEESAAVRDHLESCDACRAEIRMLRLTVSALRHLPELPAPAGILAGVRERLAPRPWYRRLPGRVSKGWLVGVPIGAVASLLVVVGVAFFQARYPGLRRVVSEPQAPKAVAPKPQAAPPAPLTRTDRPASIGGKAAPSPAPAPSRRPTDRSPAAARPAPPAPRPAQVRPSAPAPPAAAVPAPVPRQAEELQPAPPAAPPDLVQHDVAPTTEVAVPGMPSAPAPTDSLAPPSAPAARLAPRTAVPAPAPEIQVQGAPPATPGSLGLRGGYDERAAAPLPPPALSLDRFADRAEIKRALEEAPPTAPGAALAKKKAAKEEAAGRDEVLYLYARDGDEIEELRRLLRSEGGRMIRARTMNSVLSREAVRPVRAQIPQPGEVSRAWEIGATVPRRNLGRFIDAVQGRPGYQVLRPKPAGHESAGAAEHQRIRINLFR